MVGPVPQKHIASLGGAQIRHKSAPLPGVACPSALAACALLMRIAALIGKRGGAANGTQHLQLVNGWGRHPDHPSSVPACTAQDPRPECCAAVRQRPRQPGYTAQVSWDAVSNAKAASRGRPPERACTPVACTTCRIAPTKHSNMCPRSATAFCGILAHAPDLVKDHAVGPHQARGGGLLVSPHTVVPEGEGCGGGAAADAVGSAGEG